MIGQITDDELDARLRTYLVYRADRVAARAASVDDATQRLAQQLGLIRSAPNPTVRLIQVGFALLLLLLTLFAIALVGGAFREHYAPNRPLLDVPLTGQPWAVDAAYGSIWVGAYREPYVYKVAPSDGRVLDRIDVIGPVCGTVESGFNALWMSHCGINALSRVDAATLRVDRLLGYGSDQIAVAGGSVWTAHGDGIARLDPQTMASIAEIPVSSASLLAADDIHVWASLQDKGTVIEIDPVANSVVATIELPHSPTGNALPVHLVVAAGGVWVFDESAISLLRIDSQSHVVESVPLPFEPFAGTSFGDWYITYGGGLVWVRLAEDTIVGIDPQTREVVQTRSTTLGGGGGFAVTPDSIWVGNNRAGTLSGMQFP